VVLTEADLQTRLGITKIGPLRRVQQAIQTLAQKRNASQAPASQASDPDTHAAPHTRASRPMYAGAAELIRWLEHHQLERFSDIFLEQEMDLEAIRLLQKQDLIELGITKMGPQRRLLSAIAAGITIPTHHTPSSATACLSASVASTCSSSQSTSASTSAISIRDVAILEKVGAGHFGEVYRGTWQHSIAGINQSTCGVHCQSSTTTTSTQHTHLTT
jgi:hypothetical protein